ncbi:two pore calcium channel protein 1 [Nephila pilipes]|uniref:Two pore calcium channel protein 1 n=1 Tax=Nephila pilipes TaxID=299642 RepID=A0A8X6PHD1_NEPPI|nr:two pore calcium channel protein 1 [Nephila pilipes]
MSENAKAEPVNSITKEDAAINDSAISFKPLRDEIPTVVTKDQPTVVTFSKESDNVTIALDNLQDQSEQSPLSQTDLLLAATLVSDAKHGRLSNFIPSEQCVKLYIIYHHWGLSYMLYFFIVLHHAVAICEDPAVEGYHLPYWVTMCIEFACVLFYLFRLFHCASFLPVEIFCRDKKNIIVLIAIILTAIDMSCYIGLVNSGYENFAIRWSRILRPLFMVNFSESKQVRRAFRNIRKTLPDILNVLILFFLSISLFSLMAQKLFQKRELKYPDGKPYFSNYLDIYFQLYVLVTTANNPDVMMPAYDSNRWFALFFIAYLIICLYIFMNIFLAVVYNNYRKHLKNEVRKLVYMKRKSLAKAFDLLKVKKNGTYVIDFKRFNVLLKMIPPIRSPMMVNILWYVLDTDGDNVVEKVDFLQLADLLNVTVTEVKDRRSIFVRITPECFHSKFSMSLRQLVAHKYFRYFFDLMILLNAFLIAFDISDAEWFFLALFTVEILLKMYTFGVLHFFRRFWNLFDFLVIGGAIIGTSIESFMDSSADDKTRTLDILLVLRVLRLVKIIGGIDRFQVIVTTILNLGPSILTYGGVLIVVFYAFAIIGMELFHDKIKYFGYQNITDSSQLYCGNPLLKGSVFYQSQYCSNNFNNILHTFVVLFELMVVNQWQVLANGYVLVTSKAARIYFFAFHLICVIIVLNIFTAFVLEAFILEYSFCKSKLESAMEKKIIEMGLQLGRKQSPSSKGTDSDNLVIDSEDVIEYNEDEFSGKNTNRRSSVYPDLSAKTDIRFHLSKSKNVENLLQRMFENELDVDDVGPDDIENYEDETTFSLMSL